ncbi:MAG: flagellar biosynthetic protein FliQ [Alphaproteobacteria bacterium RIFCSPHIGHO2_12_FULL_63_12]|nr:MAG: flagellar biosynthetic protein FliQ [Alphaproteobacteria bacterium RIFCSPHIGHO2_12_FULL_63_12]
MSEQDVISILRTFLWAGVYMGAPLMIAALVVGVVVGLFQALTSIQEMTLTFAPKLIVMLIVFWFSAGHIGRTLTALFENNVLPMIVAGG